MNTSVKRIALPMAIVAVAAIVLSMVLVTGNMLLYSGNQDTVVHIAKIMYYCGITAGLMLVAIVVAVFVRYVIIVGYVIYIWLLMTIFGNKALKRRHA